VSDPKKFYFSGEGSEYPIVFLRDPEIREMVALMAVIQMNPG
jgi:hypothetical protein